MSLAELRERIPNATPGELELVAHYASLPEDARRERAFLAFAATGLPHRRMEAWKWSDFKQALKTLDPPESTPGTDPFEDLDGPVIRLSGERITLPDTLPPGLRIIDKADAQAFGGAEDMPLGAVTAALAGGHDGPGTVMVEVSKTIDVPLRLVCSGAGQALAFSRLTLLVREGAQVTLVESHLGGAGFASHLVDITLETGAGLKRTVFQRGGEDTTQAVTADVRLAEAARLDQVTLAFGAKVARMETRLAHQETKAEANLDAAYLCGPGRHADITTHIRHGAPSCSTHQVTKGAVLNGGRGVFQGKFLVPRDIGQQTDADMQHHALLLEEGAEVDAKPELEIYADDVECAHGNTCGALDQDQLFYMRQRGLPEPVARALLTEAFIAEALERTGEREGEILREQARDWLAMA